MKKTLGLMLGIVLIISVLIVATGVNALTVENISFSASQNGGTYATVNITANSESTVYVYTAIYDKTNTLLKVTRLEKKLTEGINIFDTEPVDLVQNQDFKVFVWDKGINPLCKAENYVNKSFYITATVYGNEYTGSVNTAQKNISFDVPKSISGENGLGISRAAANSALTVGNYHFDSDYTIAFEGADIKYKGVSVTSNDKFDIESDSIVSITMPGGTPVDYTMEVNISETVASHSFNQAAPITAETDASRFSDDTRKHMPNSAGAVGSIIIRGEGHFVKSGDKYDYSSGAGSFSLNTDSTSGNKAFEFKKTSNGKLITYATSGENEPQNPDKLVAGYKIKMLSADENTDLAYIYSSDLPKAVLTSEGQENGKYTVGMLSDNGTDVIIPASAPEMNIGTWYDVKYIYRKNLTSSNSGYTYELYINDKFVYSKTGADGVTAALPANSKEKPQFALDGFDNAKFDILFDDFDLNIVRPRADIYAEKLPQGKNTAYTFTADDGFEKSAVWYNKVLKENGLKGSLALNSDKMGTDYFGSYEFFAPLFGEGVLSASNHTLNHTNLTTSGISLENHINGAQSALRQNLPGQKVLTVCLPYNETNATATAKIKENHYGMRYTNGSSALYPTKDELYKTSFYSLTSNTSLDTMNSWIDDGLKSGRWIMEMWHEVKGDDVGEEGGWADTGVQSATAKSHFEYISSHSDEIYSGTFDDMVCYLLERQYLKFDSVSVTSSEHSYKMYYDGSKFLKSSEDAGYFDVPVTVNVTVPDNWEYVVVKANGKESFAKVYTEQSAAIGKALRKYILVDAVPANGAIAEANIIIKSVSADYEIKNDEKQITSASVNVGGYSYTGLVNQAANEITFAIPYSTVEYEMLYAETGKASPRIIPDMSDASFNISAVGDVSIGGIAYVNNTSINADNVKTIRITAANGEIRDYTVKYDYMTLSRRYNANSATIRNDYYAGAPSYLGGGSQYSGNAGSAVWQIDMSDANKTYATVSIENSGITGEDYIKINKTLTGRNARMVSMTDYGNSSDVLKFSMRFNLKEFTSNNDVLIYFNNSDIDQLAFTCKDQADGKFVLAHRGLDGNFAVMENSPVFTKNTWYSLSTVFRKDSSYPKEYIVEVYVNNTFVGSYANQNTVPSGTVHRETETYPNGKNEFTLNSWGSSLFEFCMDDYEVMTVDNSGATASVYLLGDSICRYYDESSQPQQGWGKYFYDMFTDDIRVVNYSVGGYNTNIYLNGANRTNLKSEPIWQSVKKHLKPGDYVVIAIGRNEANTTDGTLTTAAFKANLKIFADDSRALGVTPIFITSTPELDKNGSTYGEVENILAFEGIGSTVYPAKDMREFASENSLICLDLNAESYHTLKQMQLADAHEVFTGSCSGASTASANCNKDELHITETGAALMNELIVKLLCESECTLKNKLKTNYNDNHAYVKSATVTIGDTKINADVNTQRKTVSFEYTSSADLSSVPVSFVLNGTANISSNLDLTSPMTITITSPDSSATAIYTVRAELMSIASSYDTNSAKTQTHSAAYRNNVPGPCSSDYNGRGYWFADNHSGDTDYNVGTITVVDDTLSAGNRFIKFNKTSTAQMLRISKNDATNTTSAASKISVEFDVRVNSLSGDIASVSTSRMDNIFFTTKGAASGKYLIGYAPNLEPQKGITCASKPMSFGEWHKVKYIFRKNTPASGSYTMELYIDDKFITETGCKNMQYQGASYAMPAGDISIWPDGYSEAKAQFAIFANSKTLCDIDFDNIYVTYIAG